MNKYTLPFIIRRSWDEDALPYLGVSQEIIINDGRRRVAEPNSLKV